MKFGQREQRGSLQESLKTTIYITEEEFQEKTIYYNYYGYDARCKQILYVRNCVNQKHKEPTYLFIELEKGE